MPSKEFKELLDAAGNESDLIKKAILYDKISRHPKVKSSPEEYKNYKKRAIKLFHEKGEIFNDIFEKTLYMSYEALCWICLGKGATAKEIVKNAFALFKLEPNRTPPKILIFTNFILENQLDKAEDLWPELHQTFTGGIVELMEETFKFSNPRKEPPRREKIIKFSKTWEIKLAGKEPKNPKEDWILTFFDTREIFEKKLVIKENYFLDLIKKIKEIEHYHFTRGLKTIKSSTGEDITDKALIVVLATSKEKKLKFGLLLGALKQSGYYPIGVWPASFAQASAQDRKIIEGFLSKSIGNPAWFSDLTLVTSLLTESHKEKNIQIDEKRDLPEYYT
ncbi:MAG: hypothetical protein ACTSRS_04595 [Candidatus Helarchaeota archaeon]